MKILGIAGSYRSGGVVDTAVGEVLAGAKGKGAETRQVMLVEKHLAYCKNCRSCGQQPGSQPGRCVIDDDMAELIRSCLEADVLCIASPVNFGTITAVTKAFLERLTPLLYWPIGHVAPKPRLPSGPRRAVLITASSVPAPAGRLLGLDVLPKLSLIARLLGARVDTTLHFGGVAWSCETGLAQHQRKRAFAVGASLADPDSDSLEGRLRRKATSTMVSLNPEEWTRLLKKGMELLQG